MICFIVRLFYFYLDMAFDMDSSFLPLHDGFVFQVRVNVILIDESEILAIFRLCVILSH